MAVMLARGEGASCLFEPGDVVFVYCWGLQPSLISLRCHRIMDSLVVGRKITCSSLCFDPPQTPHHHLPVLSVLICLSSVQSNPMLLHSFTAASRPSQTAAGCSAAPPTLLWDSVAILTLIGAAERREGRMQFMSSPPTSRFHTFKLPSVFPLRHNNVLRGEFLEF